MTGILLGPELLEIGIEEITCVTCSEVTGERNREFKLGWFKKDEKCLVLSGIFDLILSATEEKRIFNWWQIIHQWKESLSQSILIKQNESLWRNSWSLD